MTSTLSPQYTFETVVIALTGHFAHAAAVAAAEAPGRAFNPLFLHGGHGPSRTHLLHATGNYALELQPSLKVRYVRAAEFASEFAVAVRNGRPDGFRDGYLDLDMLLVDDIQDLDGTEDIQSEFLRIFTALHNGSQQLVITADRAPSSLVSIEGGLRTWLGQGLVAEIVVLDDNR